MKDWFHVGVQIKFFQDKKVTLFCSFKEVCDVILLSPHQIFPYLHSFVLAFLFHLWRYLP